jgi:hypothetical protein
MSRRHQQSADRDRAGPSQETIGDQSTCNRCEINETSVEAENGRRERLHCERTPINGFEKMAKWAEPGDVFDMSGMEKAMDHVEHK